MSTILFEDEKFLKIAETLKINSCKYAWEFKYPANWQDREEMDKIIDKFVQDLRKTNILAFNIAYNEKKCFSRLPQKKVVRYQNNFELLVSLKSIRYNIDEESINNCAEQLNTIIGSLSEEIVRELPEYKLAEHCW